VALTDVVISLFWVTVSAKIILAFSAKSEKGTIPVPTKKTWKLLILIFKQYLLSFV